MPAKTQNRRTSHRTRHGRRRGSTLLVVMVLMGMLSLIGVLFYTFSAQERSNAEYYSESKKNFDDPIVDVDALMDHALEQIIVRTRPTLKNSALWGSRHSMMSNMVGTGSHQPSGSHPYTGEGINLIWDPTALGMGQYLPRVDQDRDGTPDAPAMANPFFNVNYSPAANNLTENVRLTDGTLPSTGVGYSYPDINNLFLSYVAKVRDDAGTVHLVVIPSYVRPQIFRDESTGAPLTDWYKNSLTANRSLRVHPDHVFVPAGPPPTTPALRLITNAGSATTILGPTGQPFPGGSADPAAPMDPTYDTTSGGAGAVTTQGRMGVWSHFDTTGTDKTRVEFDIDLDGDGVREAVWMDLDHPPMGNANGQTFVPLYAITIVDLDSVVNLNAHGNIARILQETITNVASTNPGNAFGTENGSSDTPGRFNMIHASSLGLGPAEVNPIWALRARPTVENNLSYTFPEHNSYFGGNPRLFGAGVLPWAESGNMELLWLKAGRIKFASGGAVDDTFPGEYGDDHLLNIFATSRATAGGPWLPRPGLSRDQASGNYQNDGDDSLRGERLPRPFVHPLDFAGLGSFLMPLGGPATEAKQARFVTSGRLKLLQYDRFSETTASTVKWGTSPLGTLMSNSRGYGLLDDPYEVALYAEDNRHYDDPFKAEEQAYLSLNNARLNSLKISSRLEQLAPFNFAKDSTTNSQGETIRRRFSVLSNDRKSFGYPYSPSRSWEYSTDTSGKYLFPPQFGTIPRYQVSSAAPFDHDPLRPAVRFLLEIEANSSSTNRMQRKLSLNQLLTVQGNQLVFRSLTPHPLDPGAADLAASYPYPPSSVQAEEYWARIDRQQLCRDIYVLLYLLGRGADGTAGTDTPVDDNSANVVYTNTQMREMAQFAVNIVDNMDADPVITRFEYDKNLFDGWNLDDNSYGSREVSAPNTAIYTTADANYNANYPNDSATRGEVHGVERLDLAINEAMAIHTDVVTGSDHPATFYDDTTAHNFAYVELRNISPFDVVCNATTEAWQIVVKQNTNAMAMTAPWERRLTLRSATIAPDARYTVGSPDFDTSSTSASERSVFKVDPAWTAGTPDFTMATTWMAPWGIKCDLDLIDATSTNFRVEDAAGMDLTATKGSWLAPLSVPAVGNAGAPLEVVLRRRAHPTRALCSETDNPWVDVDQMTLDEFQSTAFSLPSATANAMTIQGELDDLISRQREEPLKGQAATRENWPVSGASSPGPAYQRNTLTAENTNAPAAPATFDIWQVHLDRDYSSIGELLNVLLVSPADVANSAYSAYRQTPYDQFSAATNPGAKLAAAKVMMPAHPTDSLQDNRWHRVFEFLEVHSPYNRNLGVGSELSIARTPGRINLNMIRHPEVFAALVDDYRMMDMLIVPDPKDAPDPAGELTDKSGIEGATRDWWRQFLLARDGFDPYLDATNSLKLPLPGLPGSAPFRSLAYTGTRTVGGTSRPSVEDTLFRSLPADSAETSARRLLEVGTQTDHRDPGSSDESMIDPLVRNRLLAKIAGNSTTRSHCYAVFIAVKYFQAGEDTTAGNAIRIGGPLNGKAEPEHRGFFVVDRSKLEKAAGSGGYDFTDRNLFRAFVDYRRIIQTQ
ncbi:MAG: hypothetical protein H7062_03870 [Candidatus Saccharimonas sp.]|nr:hypothetical protein [Planctomycetaceae bacterium]